jgi:hypothetical protein
MANVKIDGTVNVKQSRGAGTALMLIFFGWALVGFWWPLIFSLWLIWLPIVGIIAIFDIEFFKNYWYYPLPAWMFGIR